MVLSKKEKSRNIYTLRVVNLWSSPPNSTTILGRRRGEQRNSQPKITQFHSPSLDCVIVIIVVIVVVVIVFVIVIVVVVINVNNCDFKKESAISFPFLSFSPFPSLPYPPLFYFF